MIGVEVLLARIEVRRADVAESLDAVTVWVLEDARAIQLGDTRCVLFGLVNQGGAVRAEGRGFEKECPSRAQPGTRAAAERRAVQLPGVARDIVQDSALGAGRVGAE